MPEHLTARARIRNFPPIHEMLYLSRFVGLRNRLRCPKCQAVGTFKMHGGRIDQVCDWAEERIKGEKPPLPRRAARRWLCKWCGYYEGPEGELVAFPDRERGAWALPYPTDPNSPEVPDPTPAEVLAEHLGETWPWRG